ncbi:hypothetical protein DK104_22895 [Salmonella enterica subsp. enterica serovar Lexington]|nr:hypothetical protein [Salmonella enterica subsp. enterica serovar Weltevreden]EAC0964500.1 hypothetical protein [Salmonella enterica subsp. enterica serovar Newport]EAM2795188.1 hypothetical protein [Salmonella enterica]EBR9008072.1 hypothetical protein [Salmonella enterica subsp. enterica serovar Richmond]EBU7427635.1 hypothetical protein [Salmonella enterica subsp. enterica serovar Lexington]EBU7738967.1 hypothetical protein [Salmonella enterica subsp. enterica serovar Bareilly]EBX440251
MRLYIFVPLLIFSVYVFFVNGVMAVLSMVMSIALIKLAIRHDYGFINAVVMVVSFVFTIATGIYKCSGYDVYGSTDIYTTAVVQGGASIKDCGQLQGNDNARFEKVKDSLRIKCGVQHLNDASHLSTGFVSAMYSAFYNEFSLASVIIEAPKRKNRCLSSIDEFLKLCPEQKIHFSQKNLQMLRDFERKQ